MVLVRSLIGDVIVQRSSKGIRYQFKDGKCEIENEEHVKIITENPGFIVEGKAKKKGFKKLENPEEIEV